MCFQEWHISLTFSLCLLACVQYPSPSACLCLPFSISPLFSLYSGRNVRYVDQQMERTIFPLSSRERAKQERSGEKQPPLPPRLMHPSSPLSARSNNPSHTSAAPKSFTTTPSDSHASTEWALSDKELTTGSLITLGLAASGFFLNVGEKKTSQGPC